MEQEAFRVANEAGKSDILLLCDHASGYIPPEYDGLGLQSDHLESHIALDIGAADLTERLARHLGATAILANFSRLLIDPNRHIGQAGLIIDHSENVAIPGNRGLGRDEEERRINSFYQPYHGAIEDEIETRRTAGRIPALVSIHSYTPYYHAAPRPWHVGVLWNRDARLSGAIIEGLRGRAGVLVGDNQPYSGRELYHTMDRHGTFHGFPNVVIEVRHDLLTAPGGAESWADLIGEILNGIIGRYHPFAVMPPDATPEPDA